jgi:1-deoxy-D-xylulose-5-phosphate reductoisomerase
MKKKVAILGSTGSIGKNLINIIKRDKKNFEIILLTTNQNYQELFKQIKFFKVKNIIITNKKSFIKLKKKNFSHKVNIFNDFSSFNKIFKNKIDYAMSAISGLEGLYPTLNIIKHTRLIAIANKEAIICGWNILEKELKKNKTRFIPVDSEHFSLHYALRNNLIENIENIYLTASGGPFLNTPLHKLDNIKLKDTLNHPNWNMGKKISVDSATLMNKVFEIIEAKKIFNISYKKINILIHPKSYVHALLKFNDGMIKIIAHDTNMTIPIHNTLYDDMKKTLITKKIDLKKLSNLNFEAINYKKFPLAKIISKLYDKDSLYETVIVATNDELVNQYLNKKIKFIDLIYKINKFINLKEFIKYKSIKPKKIETIEKLNRYVRFKIRKLSV